MRVRALTGIRGVAAVVVMLYHLPMQPAFAAFALPFLARGYLCVDLFFVLSGFVISIGYHRRVVERLSATSYGDFLVNRMARVFPLHFVVTLVFAMRVGLNISGIDPMALTTRDIVANLLMVQSWGFGTHALAGNSWSVSTELVAYLLFPLIAIWADARAGWLLLLLSLGALAGVAASGLGVEGVLDVVQRDSLLPVVRCLAGFALGVLAHRVADRPELRRLLGGDVAFVAICAALVIAFLIPRGDLAVVFLCPLLVLACYYEAPLVRALLANRVSFHLGLISYSIYLWHPLVRDVVARGLRVAQAHGLAHAEGLFVVLALLLTWLVCWLSYRIVEVKGHAAVRALAARWERRRLPPALGPEGSGG